MKIPRCLIPSEHQEQAALVKWLDMFHPNVPYFAIPNGGWRHPATAALLKAEGAKPGVPDLMIPLAIDGINGLFIEMKRLKGGKVSPAQKAFHNLLRENGYAVEVCAGFEAARTAINEYLDV
jgi:hypothetical protein